MLHFKALMVTILDGPLGTELLARGAPTPPPLWSALALTEAPEVVRSIHQAYAEAGATVHTANTFRTKRRQAGERWAELVRIAVRLARSAVPSGHLVAGSIAPLEDCYRPDLSPVDPRPEHRELARALADAGVDLLLCETFPHPGEAVVAVEEAAATGLPVWASFTAGPDADLLTPEAVREGAARAIRAGASAVLVNCVPASKTRPFVEALAGAGLGAPFGAYANAGSVDESMGWRSPEDTGDEAAEAYLALASGWAEAGASILGGCCGTGPAHIKALARRFR
jgi:S-methylmethionine-dependent homocysteine/selenocysteine methylase